MGIWAGAGEASAISAPMTEIPLQPRADRLAAVRALHPASLHFCVFIGYSVFYVLYFLHDILNGTLLAPGDGAIFYYPLTRHWQIWTPDVLAGYPAFADPQYLLWYPLRLLAVDYNTFVLSGYVLASFMAFGFVRQITGNIWAGLFAGLVYSMNGFMVISYAHPTIVHALAWLPLILWSVENLFKGANRHWFLIGAIGVACMFLGGHPQIFSYGIILVAAFIVYHLIQAAFSGQRYLKTSALCVGMIAVGVAVAAVQLIPLAEFTRLGLRQDYSFADFLTLSLSPSDSLLFLFPNISVTFSLSPYVGIITLFLALIAALCAKPRSEIGFWLFIAVISLIFALGATTPLD